MMKLFAATLLASAAPAAADTTTQATQATAPIIGIDWSGNIDIHAIKPRELTNGRAAPGNVPRRPSPQDLAIAHTRSELADASAAYQAANAIVIKPRMLANFRPACGNTGGKVDSPEDCTTAEVRAADAYNKDYERQARKRDDKISAASRRLFAATTAAVKADPSLKARLYVNGRPACGNTMTKKGPPSYCRIGNDERN
jgi:hypothetical protein